MELLPILPQLLWLVALFGVGVGIAVGAVLTAILDRRSDPTTMTVDTESLWGDLPHGQ